MVCSCFRFVCICSIVHALIRELCCKLINVCFVCLCAGLLVFCVVHLFVCWIVGLLVCCLFSVGPLMCVGLLVY